MPDLPIPVPPGHILTPKGNVAIKGYLLFRSGERDVYLLHLEDDTFAFRTQSWLMENDRSEVTHDLRFSRSTFAMLVEALVLGSSAFGVDLQKHIETQSSDASVEYGGEGDFSFADHPP